MSGSAKNKTEDALHNDKKDVFIYDRMAMLRREMLTLSMLAERFKFARKISDANLSSQTRDMASSCNLKKKKGGILLHQFTWMAKCVTIFVLPWLPSLLSRVQLGNSFHSPRQASANQNNIWRKRSTEY